MSVMFNTWTIKTTSSNTAFTVNTPGYSKEVQDDLTEIERTYDAACAQEDDQYQAEVDRLDEALKRLKEIHDAARDTLAEARRKARHQVLHPGDEEETP